MRGRNAIIILVLCLILGFLYFAVLGRKTGSQMEIQGGGPMEQANGPKKHVVLLGASVGGAWNIPALPQRVGSDLYSFEYVHGSPFDKSKVLKEILGRTENKPDVIFLKECAAYFPGDFEKYKALMIQWIGECREKGVIPIPTTVVPVTMFHAYKLFGYDILKLRNPFKYGIPFKQRRLKAILEYNGWLRSFCRENRLVVLDLEAAVRRSDIKRSLRSSLAKVDGLHLKPQAYLILDKIVLPTLAQVDYAETLTEGQNLRSGH
jgi:hypothetical protein